MPPPLIETERTHTQRNARTRGLTQTHKGLFAVAAHRHSPHPFCANPSCHSFLQSTTNERPTDRVKAHMNKPTNQSPAANQPTIQTNPTTQARPATASERANEQMAPTRSNQTKPSQVKPNQAKPNQNRTKTKQTKERRNGRKSERTQERRNAGTQERTQERTNERRDERRNERTTATTRRQSLKAQHSATQRNTLPSLPFPSLPSLSTPTPTRNSRQKRLRSLTQNKKTSRPNLSIIRNPRLQHSNPTMNTWITEKG